MYFPKHLAKEILSYLPLEFLEQILDKIEPWRDISKDQLFQKKHHIFSRRHVARHHLLLKWDHTYSEVSLSSIFTSGSIIQAVPLKSQPERGFMTCSCDGLVLLIDNLTDRLVFLRDLYVALWDPHTGNLKELPKLEIQLISQLHDKLPDGETVYSIGYDTYDDEYKAVAVYVFESSLYDPFEAWVHVFSSGGNNWKYVADFPPCYKFYKSGQHLNGTINYLVSNLDNTFIVCFHLGDESCRQISLPADIKWNDDLGVLRDQLCILCSSKLLQEIWVLENECWTKLCSFPLCLDIVTGIPVFECNKVLSIDEDDQVLFCSTKGLVVFNKKNKTWKEVGIMGSEFFIYLPSLLKYNL